MIAGTKLEEVLKEMKILVDKHIPYSQLGERSSLSEEGMKELDCSETVGIYLHKLGVMPKYVAIHTALMTTQIHFRMAIGSNKIEFVADSDKADFIPQAGDVFFRFRWIDKEKHIGRWDYIYSKKIIDSSFSMYAIDDRYLNKLKNQ